MENLSSASGAGSEPGQNPNVEQQLRSKVEKAKKETGNLQRAASEQVTSSLESAKANFQEAAQTAAGYGQGIVNEQKNKLAEIVQQYALQAICVKKTFLKSIRTLNILPGGGRK
jgi:hypothetical protein